MSKDLVPRVLSKIVESVAEEMCRLMQCVSSFSKNGALQVRGHTVCLSLSHTYTHAHTFNSHSKTLTHKRTLTLVREFTFRLPVSS